MPEPRECGPTLIHHMAADHYFRTLQEGKAADVLVRCWRDPETHLWMHERRRSGSCRCGFYSQNGS